MKNGVGADRGTLALEQAQFDEIQNLARRHAGLHFPPTKLSVVRFRLVDRMRELGLTSFHDYLRRVRREPDELWSMIEAVANNNTRFFREPDQFPLFNAVVSAALRPPSEVRIWSAGCSTGEEVFTLAMLVRHWHGAAAPRVRILGTDLSRAALASARVGEYTAEQVRPIPPELRRRFLTPAGPDTFQVAREIRSAVRLARVNLMEPWAMRRRLHVIFCRNVMIYFDRATQRRLLARFRGALEPGGYLFLGRTETMPPPANGFEFLDQAVYRKVEP